MKEKDEEIRSDQISLETGQDLIQTHVDSGPFSSEWTVSVEKTAAATKEIQKGAAKRQELETPIDII